MKLPELEKKCFYCDGFGVIDVEVSTSASSTRTETSDCAECNGVGYNLTDAGETLLEFLKRWVFKKKEEFWCEWCGSGSDENPPNHTQDCGRPR